VAVSKYGHLYDQVFPHHPSNFCNSLHILYMFSIRCRTCQMARQMSSSEVPVMSQLYLNVFCLELRSQLQGERGTGSILPIQYFMVHCAKSAKQNCRRFKAIHPFMGVGNVASRVFIFVSVNRKNPSYIELKQIQSFIVVHLFGSVIEQETTTSFFLPFILTPSFSLMFSQLSTHYFTNCRSR
jgi:hypothetical protein